MRSLHVIPISLALVLFYATGCLIQELEDPAESKECQALRAEVSLECFCDPLTYELICPDDLEPPDADMGGAGGAEPDMGGTAGVEPDIGGTAGVEPDMGGTSGTVVDLCVEPLPVGCSCDPLTGAVSCSSGEFTCDSWTPSAFDYPLDDSACPAGVPFTRYDQAQGLWVGVIRCGGGSMSRLYLSFDGAQYYPALDAVGSGEDHCELLEPGWAQLPNEQDITSGGCSGCGVSSTRSVPGPAFIRASHGELFGFNGDDSSGLTSRLVCGTSCL